MYPVRYFQWRSRSINATVQGTDEVLSGIQYTILVTCIQEKLIQPETGAEKGYYNNKGRTE